MSGIKQLSHRAALKDGMVQKVYFNKTSNVLHPTRMENEIRILTALKKNFINEPKLDYYPFPEIISSNYTTCTLTMTNCGSSAGVPGSLKKRRKDLPKFSKSEIINIHNMIQCVINNLITNLIIYIDVHPGNICVDDNNNVYLIDFDSAYYFKKTTEEDTKQFYSNFYDKRYIMFNDRYRKIPTDPTMFVNRFVGFDELKPEGDWKQLKTHPNNRNKDLKIGANIWNILTHLHLS